MRNILVLDFDKQFFDDLNEKFIYGDEFNLFYSDNIDSAFKTLEKEKFSAILCDINFSASGGIEFCKILRSKSIQIPFIIISSVLNDSEMILALQSGANDVLSKVEKINLLPSRLRRRIDDYELFAEQDITIGSWIYSPKERTFEDFKKGTKVKLTEKEAGIIKFLRFSPDKSASRNDILNKVWGYQDDISTHTLETHIYRLRKKIEGNSNGIKIIKTIPGGYGLNI